MPHPLRPAELIPDTDKKALKAAYGEFRQSGLHRDIYLPAWNRAEDIAARLFDLGEHEAVRTLL